MNRRVVAAISVGLMCSALATGCANAAPVGKGDYQLGDIQGALAYAKAQHWRDIVNVLQDGKITAEEYRSIHDADLRCNEALGWHYGPSVLDPIGGITLLETSDYRGPKKFDSKAAEECNQRYFNTVEAPYMSESRKHMAPNLLAAVRACLDASGYKRPMPGRETRFQDFYSTGKMWATGDKPYECTLKSARALYPAIPTYAISF